MTPKRRSSSSRKSTRRQRTTPSRCRQVEPCNRNPCPHRCRSSPRSQHRVRLSLIWESPNESIHRAVGMRGRQMLVGQSHPGTAQVAANSMSQVARSRVEIRPGDGTRRISASWDGVSAAITQFVGSGPFDYKFCAPVHLLLACERAVRSAGETSIGRSLKSSRRDFSGTLTLVPAGDEFCGTFVPRICPRSAGFYLDPKTLPADSDIDFARLDLTPRLFFVNTELLPTAWSIILL